MSLSIACQSGGILNLKRCGKSSYQHGVEDEFMKIHCHVMAHVIIAIAEEAYED